MMEWYPGPGWLNTNPIYLITLIIFFTLPITLPIAWKVYRFFVKRGEEKEVIAKLTEREQKKLERDRRKEIRRQKRKLSKT